MDWATIIAWVGSLVIVVSLLEFLRAHLDRKAENRAIDEAWASDETWPLGSEDDEPPSVAVL